MNQTVIACRTIEDELAAAMERTGCEAEVLWLESGLHERPKKLGAALQELVDEIRAERVLLALGSCGGALEGLRAGGCELVLPRVDDCISLLLGSVERRMRIGEEYAAYFLTEGWLRGERNLFALYRDTEEKYGRETTDELMGMMFGHYRTLGLLDSGLVPVERVAEQTAPIADKIGLRTVVFPAGTEYLEQLLTGPWPTERFVRKAPGERITAADLYPDGIRPALQ